MSLSHVNDPAVTNVFPGDPPFELEVIATIANDGHFLQYVREGEHQMNPSDLFLPQSRSMRGPNARTTPTTP